MKLPSLPADRIIVDESRTLTDGWWLTFDGIIKWLKGTQGAVRMVASPQAGLPALAGTLTVNDTGLRVEVTDYAHILRWNGAGWEWAPEDDHRAGEIAYFDVAPGSGWKAIDGKGDDGSAIGAGHPIKILKSDGTTRNNTTEAALANAFLRGAAAYNGAVTAKTVPTVAAPTFSGSPVTPTGSIGAASGSINILPAGTTLVATAAHTHTFSGNPLTPSGANSAPAATLPAPPVDYSDVLVFIRK